MKASVSFNRSLAATLPRLLSFDDLATHFSIGRTTAYQLAAAGEILSLTIGAPKKMGKRVFLLDSVLDYIDRRLNESGLTKNNGKTHAEPAIA